jgi:hypothetical protein
MTNDTIRTALREAQTALCNRLTSGDCECRNNATSCACERRNCQPHDAAATVAAFLNAPPPSAQTIRLYLGEVSPQGMRDIYAYHRWLAAAVQEAARHE